MHLLHEPLITVITPGAGKTRVTLPGALAALTRGEVRDFPRLRPHQRHVWHALLVQASALALAASEQLAPPEDEDLWRSLLTGLAGDEAAWSLVSPLEQVAFLQPPIPGGGLAGYKPVETPDALDLLVMAKNHDLKSGSLPADDPELWLYALVSLQTQEGFLGAGNYGISRMNGGFASRPALSVGPGGCPSERFQRDLARLRSLRAGLAVRYEHRTKGALALVWLAPWDGSTSLSPTELDVYYIEICRRVRLIERNGRLSAMVAGSKASRIEAKAKKGVTGDAWTPIVLEKSDAKALTLDARGWSYQQLVRLLFPWPDAKGATIEKAPLQAIAESDAETGLAFLARALVRGQGKTEGYHERRTPVSKELRRLLASRATDKVAKAAHERVQDAGTFARKVLYPALMVVFTGAPRTESGERARDDDTAKARANAAVSRFDTALDLRFFDDLDAELAVLDQPDRAARERALWIRDVLKRIGRRALDEAIACAPDAAVRHWRVRVRAHDQFEARFRAEFGARIEAVLEEAPQEDAVLEAIG